MLSAAGLVGQTVRHRCGAAALHHTKFRSLAALLTFLIIMTRNGSLIPSVLFASQGQVTNVVDMLVDMISNTEL